MLVSSLGLGSALADAIQRQEGYAPGTRAYRNNNPGNLIYVGQASASGKDDAGFAVFPSYAAGYGELERQIGLDAGRGLTLEQFIYKYCPPSQCDTETYISNVMGWTGSTRGETLAQIMSGTPSTPNTSPVDGPVESSGELVAGLTQTQMLYIGAGVVGLVLLSNILS